MKRIFLIDYENVDTPGLNGVSTLSVNDEVYIYYSEKHSRMTFGLHRRICDSPANFYYRKIKDNKKNALDNELIKELKNISDLDSNAYYTIISKDKGYNNTIKELIRYGIKVDMFASISDDNLLIKEELRKKIKERLIKDPKRSYNLTNNEINQLVNMFLSCEDKCELNKELQKMFYNEDVKYIFSRIKDITYNL